MLKETFRNLLLKALWSGVRRKVVAEGPCVIAVTGSVGKTSTKEAIAAVLEGAAPVVKSHGNLGTDTGVPLTLFGFTEPPSGLLGWLPVLWKAAFPPIHTYGRQPYYVLEYASDKAGDIDFLTRMLPPDIGVITQVAPVHLQFFKDMDDLAKEELAVSRGLAPGGYLVVNGDDAYQAELATRKTSWVFSLKEARRTIKREPGGLSFVHEKVHYQTQVAGEHQLYAVLAAIAVAEAEGVEPSVIQRGVAAYAVPAGRGRVIEGRDGMTILDETYNASPEAVKRALEMLKEFPGRRVAILGRMNELGAIAEEAHLGVAAATPGTCDLLVLVGQYAEAMAAAAEKDGFDRRHIIVEASPESLLERLDDILKPKDVVLIKGSQNGVRLERAVKRLMAHPEKAEELLVRQGAYWQQA